jgi:hypothetical protein
MNVVVIEVGINPAKQDEMLTVLQQQVVPSTVASPGFVKGAWIQSADLASGKAVMWFEDESTAKAFIDEVQASGPGDDDDTVVIRSTELYSIAAEA